MIATLYLSVCAALVVTCFDCGCLLPGPVPCAVQCCAVLCCAVLVVIVVMIVVVVTWYCVIAHMYGISKVPFGIFKFTKHPISSL